MKLSIVSPVYRAEKILPELVTQLTVYLKGLTNDFEILLVDDFSPDNSWSTIEQLALTNKKVKGIKLSRNFGQHYAITAGLAHAKGEWIVVMDCDLQDQPKEILQLFKKAQEGYDVVLAQRAERKDKFFKRFFSKSFYGVLSYLTGTKMDHTVANFGIYHRNVVNAILSMKETIRYFPTMVKWVGFRQTSIQVEHSERFEGESSYNYSKLFRLALEIILVSSDKPIRLFIKSGFFMALISLIVAIIYFLRWFFGASSVQGFTSLIISIWFLSGLIILILGFIGLYVGKTFENVKQRPIYIVEKVVE